jgi:hypothetical protein
MPPKKKLHELTDREVFRRLFHPGVIEHVRNTVKESEKPRKSKLSKSTKTDDKG